MVFESPIDEIYAAYDPEGRRIKLGEPEKEVLKQLYEYYKNLNKNKWPFTFKEQEIHLSKEGKKIFEELINFEYQLHDKKKFDHKYKLENIADDSNLLTELEEENIIQTRKSQATFYHIFNVKNKVNLKLITFNIQEEEPIENTRPYKLESGTLVFPLNTYKERESKNNVDCPIFNIPLTKNFNLEEFHHKTYSKHQTSKDQH